jgi:type VI secretion system ImpC/EvpB family protein
MSFFRWHKLRKEEDSRFVGLTLPRVLMRLPYGDDPGRIDGLRFREEVEQGADVNKYLWGNAAYAFAGVLMRSFSQTGWFVDTRGVQAGIDGGGLVAGLPVGSFSTDSPGIALKPSTDVAVSETLELTLSELGFIALCDCPDTEYSAFYSSRSIQKPERYSSPEATASARMSTDLQYMLCVSRFAHYLKVMARDLIGTLDTNELQRYLNNWIADYVCDADSSPQTKSEHPLEGGRVQLVQEPGRAGACRCVIELKPHFELEGLVAAVRLNTRMSPVQII